MRERRSGQCRFAFEFERCQGEKIGWTWGELFDGRSCDMKFLLWQIRNDPEVYNGLVK